MTTLFRYPGGKSRLSDPILEQLNKRAENFQTYCEVACGGASIALAFAEQHPEHKIVLNDLDKGVAALWELVVNEPDWLISQIKKYEPTANDFYRFQKQLDDPDCKNRGFKQLAIHQISYSGLGRRAGSPIGGREQNGKYPVDCRWNRDRLVERVETFHELLNGRTTVSNKSLFTLLNKKYTKTLFYIDPPYFVNGEQMYVCGFSEEHHKLADKLKTMKNNWVLSYDDCPPIKKLYKEWAFIKPHIMTYSIATGSKKGANMNGKELIITRR